MRSEFPEGEGFRLSFITPPTIRFWVDGVPVPKGSHRAYPGKGRARGRIIVTDQQGAKLKAWQSLISIAARQAMQHQKPWDKAVGITLNFFLPRPDSCPNGRFRPEVKPDLDKCVRAVWDALEGIVFTNDSRVCFVHASKLYENDAQRPGVGVTVVLLDEV